MTGYSFIPFSQKCGLGGFLLALFFTTTQSFAQGDLLLYPKRLVFEGAQRSQTLNLANSGRDTVRYLISVVQIRMNKEGAFETITRPDSGQHFADRFFRFYPRSVVLAPNESQAIKVQLINTGELQPGEYRSHLYFRSEPDKKPLGEEKKDTNVTGISVDLRAVFGITLPIIIRSGTPDVSIHLTEPSLTWQQDTVPSLKVTFDRTGSMSAYGDIAVDYIPSTGKMTRVATVKGMAVYAPNVQRQISLPLITSPGINYHEGKLSIAYTTQGDAKLMKMAETELVLH